MTSIAMRFRSKRATAFTLSFFTAFLSLSTPTNAETAQSSNQAEEVVHQSHGIAMHGDLKYPETFTHFDYANPDAPKGGIMRLASTGGFDSLNPFILKGTPASGLTRLGQGFLYDS